MKLTIPLFLFFVFLLCSCSSRRHVDLAQHDASHQNTERPYFLIIKDRDSQTEEIWYVRQSRARKANKQEREANIKIIDPSINNDKPLHDRDLGAGGDKKPIRERDMGNGGETEPTPSNDRDLGKGSDKEPMPSD